MSVEESAVNAVVQQRLDDGFCVHVRKCACRAKLRVSAWLTLHALERAGWAIRPASQEVDRG